MMPGQPYRGKLSKDQTANMLTIAARPPAENARRITAEDGGLGILGILPQTNATLVSSPPLSSYRKTGNALINSNFKAAFGITVEPSMISVPGRVLHPPSITFGRGGTVQTNGGSWNLKGKTFHIPKMMAKWTILKIGTASILDSQCKTLTKALKDYGMQWVVENFKDGLKSVPYQEFIKTFDGSLERSFDWCKENKIKLAFVLLPSENAFLHDRVKFWGDYRYGMFSS